MMDSDRESVFLAATDIVQGQLHATAVDTDGVLRHLLNITHASQKVVLLDCCFSGAFTARNRFRGGVRAEPRRASGNAAPSSFAPAHTSAHRRPRAPIAPPPLPTWCCAGCGAKLGRLALAVGSPRTTWLGT
jgi:hypothetical protein